jgi:capsular exopolysaccharide synthesis family protein
MAESVAELQLSDYLDIARRRKWIIVSLAILALAAAIAVSALQTPLYRAGARVRVEASGGSNIIDDNNNISSGVRGRNLQNEVEFAKSDRVNTEASSSFTERVTVTVGAASSSDTLTFTAVDADAQQAADVANTFANAYVQERSLASGERFIAAVDVINARLAIISTTRLELEQALETSQDASSLQIQISSLDTEEVRLRAQLNEIDVLSQLNSSASVAILRAAEAPSSPFSPSWVRNIGLAIVAGLILGVGAALILETLDDTILTKQDLESAADGVPVLGLVPTPQKTRFRKKRDRKLITSRTGAFTEAFRTLRSAIELGQTTGSEIRSILVTSANAAEGKSTVVAHLAVAFARSGSNVLVIDADMHNARQHEIFGIANESGLAEHLAKVDDAEIVTEQASGEGLLSVMPAGSSGSSPAELLRSVEAQEFIEKLSFVYDLVIIDSPPLRPVADTLSLARMADATLLVSMRGQTNAVEVQRAMELLARAQTRPFGAVLNSAEENEGGYSNGYGARRK